MSKRLASVAFDFTVGDRPDVAELLGSQLPIADLDTERRGRHAETGSRFSEGQQ